MQGEEQSGKQPRRNRADHLKPFRFQPGSSGNPHGRPKRDRASEISQQLFEQYPDEIGRALIRGLMKADAALFRAVAERAFGKLKEQVEVTANVSIVEQIKAARQRLADAHRDEDQPNPEE